MSEEPEEVKWSAELEVALFHSMHGHKPVGLNKHFHMACIQHRLLVSVGTFLTTEQIWAHLRTLYDLSTLNDFEKSPLVDEAKQDFFLPESFFSETSKTVSTFTAPNEGEIDNVRKLYGRSTSPSPVSSPLNKPASKKKRT